MATARDQVYRVIESVSDGTDTATIVARTALEPKQVTKAIEALKQRGEIVAASRGFYTIARARQHRTTASRAVPLAFMPRDIATSMARKARFTEADTAGLNLVAAAGATAADTVRATDMEMSGRFRHLVADLVARDRARWIATASAPTLVMTASAAARWCVFDTAWRVMRGAMGMGVASGRGVGSAANLNTIVAGFVLHDHELDKVGLRGAAGRRADMRRHRGVEIPTQKVANSPELSQKSAALVAFGMAGLVPVPIGEGALLFAASGSVVWERCARTGAPRPRTIDPMRARVVAAMSSAPRMPYRRWR